jgi:hypothetical protein
MLCRAVRLDPEIPLLQLIEQKREKTSAEKKQLSHREFTSEVCLEYLKQHPELAAYSPQLALRIWTFYKYAWYTSFAQPEESSFDRFLKWHLVSLAAHNREHWVDLLEEICKKNLPATPIDRSHLAQLALS